jgi:hypothetical protein
MGLLYYVPASAETLDAAFRRVERYGVLGNEGVSLRAAVAKAAGDLVPASSG